MKSIHSEAGLHSSSDFLAELDELLRRHGRSAEVATPNNDTFSSSIRIERDKIDRIELSAHPVPNSQVSYDSWDFDFQDVLDGFCASV